MKTLKSHTIYSWEDFEHRYAIKNAPEDSTIIYCLYKDKEKEYEKEMEKEDGNIFCIEISSEVTDSLERGDYEYRLFLEGKKRKSIASWSLTIA